VSLLEATTTLRPGPGGIKAAIASLALALAPAVMAAARRVWPIPGVGKFWMVTRYDDVREVFAADHAFMVPYHENLQVITGNAPFFLGMTDTPDYRAQIAAARSVVRADDLTRLGDDAEGRATAIVAAAGGEIEVVGLIRRVAFDLIASYFGVPEPATARLDVWGVAALRIPVHRIDQRCGVARRDRNLCRSTSHSYRCHDWCAQSRSVPDRRRSIALPYRAGGGATGLCRPRYPDAADVHDRRRAAAAADGRAASPRAIAASPRVACCRQRCGARG